MSELPQIASTELAVYLLAEYGQMSHLKLQKLLYYVEAWHLAFYNRGLIRDDFKAWVHGPVCVPVWHMAKDLAILNGEILIKSTEKSKVQTRVKSALAKDQLALINDVLEEYGSKSAHYLEWLTHSEQPWIEARGGLACDEPSSNRIGKKTMKAFYQSRLKSGGQK